MPGTEAVEGEVKYDVNYNKLSSNLTGEHYLNNLTTSGRRGTGTSFGKTSVNVHDITKSIEAVPSTNNKEKIKCQYYFKGCSEALDRAISNFDDIFSLGNSLNDLKNNLALLWDQRIYREEPYARLINKVQTLLLEVKPEEITLDKLKVLLEILNDASDKQVLTKDEIKEYFLKFARTGYDIFKGLR